MAEGSSEVGTDGNAGDWPSPWLRRAGGLALVLTAWLSAFLPDDKAKPYAYAGAAVLTLAYAVYLYIQRRHRPPSQSAPAVLVPETSLLRAFLPFEQGDTLIGRGSDIADALAILQSSEFRFGVIWGESGCGKTSFLRAGLVPALRQRGHTPVYLSRPGAAPAEAVEQALASTAGTSRVFVIVDQFEEYFLTHVHHQGGDALGKRLQTLLGAHPTCSLVIAIRRDFFARLQHLAPEIPDPTSPRTTFELANLRKSAAREVLAQASADEAVRFEAALVDAVIEDLEADGEVWPVELQLIGTRLKRVHVHQKTVYVALGRRAGVIGTFIRDEVARLPKPKLGEIVLRKLCAPGGIAKSPVDVTLEALAADVRARDPALLTASDLAICLSKLQEARIIVQTGDDTFNLTHDALAPLIQRGTTGVQGKTEAADRSISFYLSAYRNDRNVRIPLRTLLQIRRDATRETLADRLVRALLAKSWRSVVFSAVWPAALAVALLGGAAYAAAFGSWSIGITRATFASARPSIVIRSSSPFTRFLPGMDRVVVETYLEEDQVDPNNAAAANQVPRGDIWGVGAIQKAAVQIAAVLEPVERIPFLRITGPARDSVMAFATTVNASGDDVEGLLLAANAIGAIGRVDRTDATDDVAETLVRMSQAPASAPLRARLAANLALLQFARHRPGMLREATLTLPKALAILTRQSNIGFGSDGRLPASETPLVKAAIQQLLLSGAAAPTESDLAGLLRIADALGADVGVRATALELLVSYAARNEQLAGPALEYLLTAVKTRGPDSRLLMADVVQSMVIIARDHPRATRSPAVIALLQSVLDDMLSHKNVDTLIVPLCIVARASAAALPMPLTNALRARVHDTQVPANARGLALIALSHLAVADPQLLDQAMRRALVDLLPYAAPEPERSIKLLWLQALEVTAELAAAGQLDPEFVQIALRSIGPKRLGLAGTFLPFWGDSAFDMNLQRLVDAGGRVEGQTIDEIVSAIVDTDAIGLEFLAADTLIVAAKAAPPEVQARRTKFEKLYRNRGPSTGEFKRDVRRRILAALGRTDAALGGSRERSQRCKNLLAKESSAEMWQRGTYCVFYDALDHPETLVQWRTYLNGMLDQGVGERMAARMTLEMLAVVPGVVEARNNPAVAPLTRARLRYDLGNREPHISIAARAALLALADHP